MSLESIGFDGFFQNCADERITDDYVPGRVITETRGSYIVRTEAGDSTAEPTGRMMFNAESREALPAVGDWVLVSELGGGQAVIHDILPRKTSLVRKKAGKRAGSQIIAANVDTVFVVQGLDGDFNERRLERYLVVITAGGSCPVILLSKRDLVPDEEAEEKTAIARSVSNDAPVLSYSVHDEADIAGIGAYVRPTETACFIGSSGAGKSTLINRLIGRDVQQTADVRDSDSKGRHTTVQRQMFMLDGGGILIDTPGMRELGIWDEGEGLELSFPEIVELEGDCRFRDCTHTDEPGCAVLAAVKEGIISHKRYQSWRKLVREAEFMAVKRNEGVRAMKKKREKHYGRWLKEVNKFKGKS